MLFAHGMEYHKNDKLCNEMQPVVITTINEINNGAGSSFWNKRTNRKMSTAWGGIWNIR